MLVGGGSCAAVARKFSLNYHVVRNHKLHHIPKNLAEAAKAQGLIKNGSLLSQVQGLLSRGQEILDRTFEDKHYHLSLKAIDSVRGVVSMLSDISYKIQEGERLKIEMEEKLIQRKEDQVTSDRARKKSLECLSMDELEFLAEINAKMEAYKPDQDTEVPAIPDVEIIEQEPPQLIRKAPEPDPPPPEEDPDIDPDEEYLNRPIQHTELSYTKWSEHPSNRRRRY